MRKTIFAWMINHFKLTVVIVSTFMTGIFLPLSYWAFGLILNLRQTQAKDIEQDKFISANSRDISELRGQYASDMTMVKGYLKIISDREYQELKEARQRGWAKP